MTTPTPKTIQQGRNISGRPWKVVGRPSISKVSQGNGAVVGWQERVEERKRMSVVKQLERELKREKREKMEKEKKEKKERRERKERKERENVIAVRVSDAKVRRMKRKELRSLKKT